MDKHIYTDTNAFRYFGEAFAKTTLADDLRDKIVTSPLSAFEVFAQLANEHDGDNVLSYIHAIPNWTNPKHSALLPWPKEWLYQVWFQHAPELDAFTQQMQDAFNMCLGAKSVSEFRQLADDHKKAMDDFKLTKAQEFKAMIDEVRNMKVTTYDVTDVWFTSIAKSLNADPKSKPVSEIIYALSAHHEFEQIKLNTALGEPKYNPLSRKNQNDIIDVEQLVYLADPSLYMLTADGGFKSKITRSEQAARIITAAPDDLRDAKKAEWLLRFSLA